MNKFDNHSLFSDIVAANDDSIGGPMCNLLFFFEAKTASLVSAKLRPINASASAGIAAELGRVKIEVRFGNECPLCHLPTYNKHDDQGECQNRIKEFKRAYQFLHTASPRKQLESECGGENRSLRSH